MTGGTSSKAAALSAGAPEALDENRFGGKWPDLLVLTTLNRTI